MPGTETELDHIARSLGRAGKSSSRKSTPDWADEHKTVHSRPPNQPCADEADADEVQNLWQENQDLHERILNLEVRLQEVEAERGALQFRPATNQSQDTGMGGTRSLARRRSPGDCGGMSADTAEKLVALRSRLRWQKAIVTVRSQIKAMKNFSDRLKLTASELSLQAAREVPKELKREIDQERRASEKRWQQVEAERTTLRDLFAVEKSNLERENQSLKDRMFELERASHLGLASADGSLQGTMAAGNSGQSSGNDVLLMGDEDEEEEGLPQVLTGGGPVPSVSLMDDLRSPVRSLAVTSFAPSDFQGSASVGAFAQSRTPGGGINHMEEYDEIREEMESLRNYTSTLESKLTGFSAEKDELVTLRQRVRQLEKAAREEKQRTEHEVKQVEESPWWSLGWGNIFCTTARAPDPAPPFVLQQRAAVPVPEAEHMKGKGGEEDHLLHAAAKRLEKGAGSSSRRT